MKRSLLSHYRDVSFKTAGRSLSIAFMFHVIIFLCFTVMFLSFIKEEKPFVFILISLCLFYFLIKFMYGLFLLLDGYDAYHEALSTQTFFIFILAFNVIFYRLTGSFIYSGLSLGLYFLSYVKNLFPEHDRISKMDDAFRHNEFKIIIHEIPWTSILRYLLASIVVMTGVSYLMNPGYEFLLFTFLFTEPVGCIILTHLHNYAFIDMELYLLKSGMKSNPEQRIGEYLAGLDTKVA